MGMYLYWKKAKTFVFNSFLLILTGKVHGSLSRAGKVKGQTPKVEKQDKKKKPKGRAFQHLKYKKKFQKIMMNGLCVGTKKIKPLR